MEETLPEYVGQTCDWYDVPCHATSFAAWLADFLLYVPRKVFQLLMEALGAIVAAIPVPDAFAALAGANSGLAGGVLWLLDLCALDVTFPLLIGALLARFVLRRIPFIG